MSTTIQSWVDIVSGVVRLVRPINFVLSLAGVTLGAYLAVGSAAFSDPIVLRVLIAMGSAAMIGAAGNALNDFVDREIDRINRPDRPLVSGVLPERVALLVWAACASTGVGLAVLLGPLPLAIAASSVLLTFLYSWSLKRYGLPGNVIVGLVVACAVLYGALAAGRMGHAWIGAGFAFLTMLAREIVKDVEDMEGDLAVGVRTLPARIGVAPAVVIAIVPIVVAMLASPLPFLILGYGGLYLAWMVGTNVVLLFAIWCLTRHADGVKNVSRSSALIKAGVAFGIIALFAA